MRPVTVTTYSTGCLGMFLRRALGERRCLAFGRPLVLIKQARELLDLGFEFRRRYSRPRSQS